jgi:hypothetical protein
MMDARVREIPSWLEQCRTYSALLASVKAAQGPEDLRVARRTAWRAELKGQIRDTQAIHLTIARGAMRKALRCRTFQAVARLEEAFAQIHVQEFPNINDARFFFEWLLVARRTKLFNESEFGKSVGRLFKRNPKLIVAMLPGGLLSVKVE